MFKAIILTSLFVCAVVVYAADTNEHQHHNKNKHNLEQSKLLEDQQHHNGLENRETPQLTQHKEHTKHTLSNAGTHGAKHHVPHTKVKGSSAQAPKRVRKPQREERKKKGVGKVQHTAGGRSSNGHKRKHSKRGQAARAQKKNQ